MATKIHSYRDLVHLHSELYWCYDDEEGILHDPLNQQVHRHYPFSAWMVYKGWAEIAYEVDKWGRVGDRRWVILPGGQRHQRFHPETELLSIAFDARWSDGTHLMEDGLPAILPREKYPELEHSAKNLCVMVRSSGGKSWDLRKSSVTMVDYFSIQSRFQTWLSVLISTLYEVGVSPAVHSPVDHRVAQAVELMTNNVPGIPLTTEQVASEVGLSEAQLRRLFEASQHVSISQFQRRLRTEYAQRLLLNVDVPIGNIARDLGFNQIAAFSNWFRRQTNQSPRAFRYAFEDAEYLT